MFTAIVWYWCQTRARCSRWRDCKTANGNNVSNNQHPIHQTDLFAIQVVTIWSYCASRLWCLSSQSPKQVHLLLCSPNNEQWRYSRQRFLLAKDSRTPEYWASSRGKICCLRSLLQAARKPHPFWPGGPTSGNLLLPSSFATSKKPMFLCFHKQSFFATAK